MLSVLIDLFKKKNNSVMVGLAECTNPLGWPSAFTSVQLHHCFVLMQIDTN